MQIVDNHENWCTLRRPRKQLRRGFEQPVSAAVRRSEPGAPMWIRVLISGTICASSLPASMAVRCCRIACDGVVRIIHWRIATHGA